MQVIEASTVMPLDQEETWDFFFSDKGRRLVALSDMVVAIENYQMRADGTPGYTMAYKAGPITVRATSDYFVYEPPNRTVNRILDSPFGGTFYIDHESVSGGTRVNWRWEVEPQTSLAGLSLPVTRPLLARSLQRDLDTLAKAAAAPQRDRQHQMHVERTVIINRPIEKVFEYVSNPENDPTWIPQSLSHRKTSPGPMRVGAATEEEMAFLGRTATYTWEVKEYEPPHLLAYRATSGLLPVFIRVRFEPVESGTRMVHSVDVEPRGVYYRVLTPLMPWATQRILMDIHRRLKALLEGGTIPSQRPESAASGVAGSMAVGALLAGIVALFLLATAHQLVEEILKTDTEQRVPCRR